MNQSSQPTALEEIRPSPPVKQHSRSIYILLAIVVLVGLTLRTWNIRWDDGMNPHPDERSTTCFYAPSIGWPESLTQARDPQASPLNPLWDRENDRRRSFTYGHFPLYLGILLGEVLQRLAPIAENIPILSERVVGLMERSNQACGGFAFSGRLLIALLDTVSILALFALGRRLYGQWGGLMTAALYAVSAQAIQLSHFFAMDPASTTFTVLAVLGGVQMVQDRSWRSAILTGIAAGLAIASKFSALPILAVPVVAAGIVAWKSRPTEDGESGPGWGSLKMLIALPVIFILAFAAFFVTSPYAILDWENFVQATLVEQGQMVRGLADFPFTRQYRNTTPYLYFIEQQVIWGLGLPLGLFALVGTLWALIKLPLLRALPAELIVWAWVVPYFGLTGAFLAKFNRYVSPVLPFVLLFGAGMVITVWRYGRSRRQSGSGALISGIAGVLAAVAILGGTFWSLAYVNGVYNQPHPWVSAARWMAENVAPGSRVLCEQWDDCMPWGLPDEQDVNQANNQIIRLSWGPYEEDTAEKATLLRQSLVEADYVAYSSKRIYDSVDQLPERYPMTTRYYELMFDEQLGFEIAYDQTTEPALFGFRFPDQEADESWSLYDHPRVTIFRKTRTLSDAEFNELLGGSWEGAQPWYRGADSPLDPLLTLLGLGSSPESQGEGLVSTIVALLSGDERPDVAQPVEDRLNLSLDRSLNELQVVDDYRWNSAASESPALANLWWWFAIFVLGWAAWPLTFAFLRPLRDGGIFFAKTVGWLLAGWLLWIGASAGLFTNTVRNAWLSVALVLLIGLALLIVQRKRIGAFLRQNWPLALVSEGLFAVAYLIFIRIRMANPDLWQPWFGGEKFMEFAFLNGILRSPTFPPVDPHFAGGFINYYYFGIYLVGHLIKVTGIYAEVAFNLAIPTLFALTVVNAFGVAYSAVRRPSLQRKKARRSALRPEPFNGAEQPDEESLGEAYLEAAESEDRDVEVEDGESLRRIYGPPAPEPATSGPYHVETVASQSGALEIDLAAVGVGLNGESRKIEEPIDAMPAERDGIDRAPEDSNLELGWREGLGVSLLAPLFVAILGNLDAFAQIVRRLVQVGESNFESAIPGLETAVRALSGLWLVATTDASLPAYDFWAPSRVIPFTINEFPYWSFTFADLHPHMIGIPFSVFFLGLILALLSSYGRNLNRDRLGSLLLLLFFALTLGTLASVNLWELPTYFGLGVLALATTLFRGRGGLSPLALGLGAVTYLAGAYVLFYPFFQNYANVGASGVGLVREPDEPGEWLLIWGFFLFILATWSVIAGGVRARAGDREPSGLERWLSIVLRRFDRLPRFLSLQSQLVKRPTPGFLLGLALTPILFVLALAILALSGGEYAVLALCLPFLGLSFLLLWRRGRAADPGSLLVALLTTTGFAILAGTQVIYLKDFLQGGDWYRMNTLFKFFIQVWVLWGLGAAIALPRIFRVMFASRTSATSGQAERSPSVLAPIWVSLLALLLIAATAYPLWGTGARSEQRFPGWRPEIGTLDGMAFMQQGAFTWPDDSNPIELTYDHEAIQWLLDHVRGNLAIAESSHLGYYRAAGTRIASMTGLSGLSGMHESEQRYGDLVGARNGLLSEFWNSRDPGRILQIGSELDVTLIYVGQLERHLHPETASVLEQMASEGRIERIFENQRSVIYALPGRLEQDPDGIYFPAGAERL